MIQFSYIIKDELGLHARPAGLIVKEAGKCTSKITISSGKKNGDAKRIFSVMGLAVKQGEEITITVEGPDEKEEARAFQVFLESNL
jgi:Phosphotransferase System HPr (HPr) Family